MVRFNGRLTVVVLTSVLALATEGLARGADGSSGGGGGSRGKRTERVVEVEYQSGIATGVPGVFLLCQELDPQVGSCIHVATGVNERFVSVEILDATGLPVPAYVRPDSDSTLGGESFCGSTTKPVRITPGLQVQVSLNTIDPATPCAGLATRGVARLTFSKRA